MTQDKTIFEGAKWNSEPQQITINYNFSEKMVNDYFRALAHLLKSLHDDLALCKFGVPMRKDNNFKTQITIIKEQTSIVCERIYDEDKKLMIETYNKVRRMKNNVLGILNNAPDYLRFKGGDLNQSPKDIEHNSKVYATTYSKIPPSMYHSIEPIIREIFSILEIKVNKLKKECSYTISSEDMPSMENIRAILLPKTEASEESLLRAIWEQWTMERDIQPMKNSKKPDTVKAATFYHILTRAKCINCNVSKFYNLFNADLGIDGSRRSVSDAVSTSRFWDDTIVESIKNVIKSSLL